MADNPNTEPKNEHEPPVKPPADQASEMTSDELEKVSGGVASQDFHFVKKVDKSSPSL